MCCFIEIREEVEASKTVFCCVFFSALEDESVVAQFLPFLSSKCLQSLFLAGSVEALGVVIRSFVLAGVDGLMFERGVKRGVDVLFGGGVKRSVVLVLVGCWIC